ncbi:MAG: hypothetical protein KIS94_09675 [Chitinophagales bacterium]|nr:hypothetical protein [Chitinophagales bacterium]
MKKYFPYIAVIVAFGIALTWFAKTQAFETVNQREGNFAVKKAASITRIVLDDTEKKHVELSLNNGIWYVNNTHIAREELITQLLDAVTRVSSLAPVPSNAHDNVMRQLLTRNIKVQVFTGKSDKPEKVYYVGGATVDNKGTYMLLEINGTTASRPHITYIPGHYGYLTPRFEMDAEVWRSRVLFNEEIENIQKLTLTYSTEEDKSFTIERVAADSFAVKPLNEKYLIEKPYEQKYVKQYLSFYNSVFVEAFDNALSSKDSIRQTKPYCVFEMQKKDGSVKKVTLYYMPANKRSKAEYDRAGNELLHDVDHYYADIDQKDFAIVQYYVFGKLLRSYKDFFFKPTA